MTYVLSTIFFYWLQRSTTPFCLVFYRSEYNRYNRLSSIGPSLTNHSEMNSSSSVLSELENPCLRLSDINPNNAGSVDPNNTGLIFLEIVSLKDSSDFSG
ncbi:hypothetical protein OROGR_016131 [Orobanche gracilis]